MHGCVFLERIYYIDTDGLVSFIFFSGDELLSSAYDFTEVDDAVYEVDCSMITVKENGNYNTGANASAEEAPEELEEGESKVNNIIHSFNLIATNFEKKEYMAHLKVCYAFSIFFAFS